MSVALSQRQFPVATAKEPKVDASIELYKSWISKYGFRFRTSKNITMPLIARLNNNASSLTEEEWKKFPYPFLESDKKAIIDLQQGKTNFTLKELEVLDSVLGDFFDYTGTPRNSIGAPGLCYEKR